MSIKAEFNKRAFTLVELLIVVIIIAILAVIAIPKFTNSSLRSKEAALRAELKLQRNAVALMQNDMGCVPNQLSDLTLSGTGPTTCYVPSSTSTMTISSNTWKGPYLSSADNDPVSGSAMSYTSTGATAGTIKSSMPGGTYDSTGVVLYSSY